MLNKRSEIRLQCVEFLPWVFWKWYNKNKILIKNALSKKKMPYHFCNSLTKKHVQILLEEMYILYLSTFSTTARVYYLETRCCQEANKRISCDLVFVFAFTMSSVILWITLSHFLKYTRIRDSFPFFRNFLAFN